MESVAPPGGVMLSESTARLVEDAVVLGDLELVQIKGADQPAPCPATAGYGEHRPSRRTESPLVGRSWELNTITAILDEAIGGAGCVVTVVGPPGIGKSDCFVNPQRSRPHAGWRSSPPTASRIPTTSRSTRWPDCCAMQWESTISTPSLPGAVCVTSSRTTRPRRPRCSSTTYWASGTPRPRYPMSPRTRVDAG